MTDSVSGKNVLIVEDDMIISMVLERMINKLGHNVMDKLITGQRAIDCTLELKPDLILMDIQLKDDIDGITAMEQIREKSDIQVIYITGNSDQYNMSRARETGFVDYLVKPIQMSHLKKSIDKAFSQQHS